MHKPATKDFFGRWSLSIEELDAEQAEIKARRWAEKVAASRDFGTPPEQIYIVTYWSMY